MMPGCYPHPQVSKLGFMLKLWIRTTRLRDISWEMSNDNLHVYHDRSSLWTSAYISTMVSLCFTAFSVAKNKAWLSTKPNQQLLSLLVPEKKISVWLTWVIKLHTSSFVIKPDCLYGLIYSSSSCCIALAHCPSWR